MRPLVLVHGFMGGSDQWATQASLGEGRELIAVDLPGFGKNAAMDPIGSIRGFAEWVLEELTARGVEQFDLLGHSMGGMIVQEMVHIAPARVDRLVLYGTGAKGVLPGRFESIETSMERARADGTVATARRISATWFQERDDSPAWPACAAIAENASLPGMLRALEAMRDWNGNDLTKIACPTLVLWGDGDRTYKWPQVEKLWQSIPISNLAVVPFCAHAVHMEQPDVFNSLVMNFFGQTRQ